MQGHERLACLQRSAGGTCLEAPADPPGIPALQQERTSDQRATPIRSCQSVAKALHASPQQALCRDKRKEEHERGTPVTGLIRYWAASSFETSSLTGICKHRLQVLSREPKSCSPHLASYLPRPSDSHHVLMQAIMLDVSPQLWPPPMCDSGPGCNTLIEFASTGQCCSGLREHSRA